MIEHTSASYTPSGPPGTPTREENGARERFQAVHYEVGFEFRPGREPPWVAYWLAKDDERRYVTGATLTEVLGLLAEAFPAPLA